MDGPIIVLSIDTVRQDVFKPECFPESWPLITSDFTRFPNSISSGVATPHAFPGIFAGTPPIDDGEFKSDTVTIAELINGRTVAFTNNGHLRVERGYSRGVDDFSDTSLPTYQNMDASFSTDQNMDASFSTDQNMDASFSTDQNMDLASLFQRIKENKRINNSRTLTYLYRWYKSLCGTPPYSKPAKKASIVTDWLLAETRDPPRFLWAHYMDAHKPFIPERAIDGPEVPVSKVKLGYLNDYDREDDPPSEEHKELLWELYKANVRYLDRGLGRALQELQSRDWYDDALIFLVSDHGELFGEYSHMWHPMTIDPVEELIDVPLAVKFPSETRAGDVIQHRVQHADIPATIASVLGQQKHPREDTYPLLDSSNRLTISKSNTSIRATGPDGYIIRRRNGTEEEHGTVTDELRQKVRGESFPNVKTNKGKVRGIDDVQRMEQLEALGYR